MKLVLLIIYSTVINYSCQYHQKYRRLNFGEVPICIALVKPNYHCISKHPITDLLNDALAIENVFSHSIYIKASILGYWNSILMQLYINEMQMGKEILP